MALIQSNETRLQALAREPDPDTPKDLLHVRATARPLFFRSDDPETPLGGVGTCFVVAYRGQIFVITANHLIKETHSQNVMVFPFDGAKRPMKLSNGYRSEQSTNDDPSDYDIIMYKATLNALPGRKLQRSTRDTVGRTLIVSLDGHQLHRAVLFVRVPKGN